MAFLETIGLLLTSQTAGSVAKFLYEKVEGYIREKLGGKPSGEVENLKKQVEELKNKLEAKEKDDVTASEVEELKQTVERIEKNESPVPANIISPDVFQKWSEDKNNVPDVEDQALILRRQLHVILEKASELGIKDKIRFRIQDLTVSIEQKIRNLKEYRQELNYNDNLKNRERVDETERSLAKNLLSARDILRGY